LTFENLNIIVTEQWITLSPVARNVYFNEIYISVKRHFAISTKKNQRIQLYFRVYFYHTVQLRLCQLARTRPRLIMIKTRQRAAWQRDNHSFCVCVTRVARHGLKPTKDEL